MKGELTLRQKAEAVLKEKQSKIDSARSETDVLRLVHELEVYQIELEMINEELIVQNEEKEKRVEELILLNKKLFNLELIAANKVLTSLNKEKEERAAELFVANKELLFQNNEKTKRAEELIIANMELLFQNDEKAKRAAELILANKELLLSNDEKAKLAVELILVNKELLFQNDEKTQRAEELILAKIELLFQNKEKEKRAEELSLANKLIAFQRDRLEEISSLVPGVVDQYRLRPDGTSCFPYASEAINRIYRVTPDEVREDAGKVFSNIHPDDHDDVVASIQSSAKELTPWQQEYRVKFEDSTTRSLFGNALPRYEDDGSVLWHGFITDITDHKRIEHQLEQSLKELQVLYRLSQLAVEKDIAMDAFCQSFVDTLPKGWQYPGITCARMVVDGVEFSTENFEDSAWKQSAPINVNGSLIGLIEVAYLKEMPIADEGPFLKEERKLIDTLALQLKQIITRKKGEEEIINQLALINALLDSIPDMIFFKDNEGVYLGCNPHFSTFVGKSRNDIIGKTDYELFEKAIADSFRQYDCEMLVQKLPRNNEEWVTYADGRKVLLDTLKTPYWADDGSLIGILGISRDITERKIAEDELNQMSTRLTLATQSGGVGIWDYDILNDILEWDDQMFALYGIKEADFSGVYQAWRAGLHPEDVEQGDAYIQMAIRGEKEFNPEFRVVWPDGSVHNIRAFAIVQRDNFGKPLHMIGTNWDITAQKQSEQEIKLKNKELHKVNAERDKFYSVIAHDLRGPIGGIMRLTELLADESQYFSVQKRKSLGLELSHSSANVFNLLEQLLDWSNSERGLTDFNPQTLVLNDLVTKSVKIVDEQARIKSVELIVNVSPDLKIFGDENMLQTIIRNLISNAIKYTQEGGKVIVSGQLGENRSTLISVKDTGIGMSRKMLENLFRMDVDTKRPGTNGEKSTGLGLLLCKEFIEKHGGNITVESKVGKGSAFHFMIPYGELEADKKSSPIVVPEVIKQKTRNNLKILIAEDDEISGKLLKAMVKGFSSEILIAKTGYLAIESFVNNPDINLILLDIAMPELDGYEVARRIRKLDNNVVIIAQTALASSQDIEMALAAGCNDHIGKPVKNNVLKSLILKYFDKSV